MNKVVVEVNTTRLETATMIKNNLVGLLEERLFPAFNKKLDEYNRSGKVVRFHDLTLDLTIPRDDYLHALETGITDRFSRAIEKKLSGSTNPSHDEVSHEDDTQITVEENRREQFLYFLEKGHLPWYGSENDLRDLLSSPGWEESLNNHDFFVRLVNRLKQGEETIDRFIYQLDDRQITSFLQRAHPAIKEASAPLLHQLQRFSRDTRNRLIHFLLAASLEKGNNTLENKAKELTDSIFNEKSSHALDSLPHVLDNPLAQTLQTGLAEIISIYGRADILPLQRSDDELLIPFLDKRNHPNEVGEADKPSEKNRADERNRSGKEERSTEGQGSGEANEASTAVPLDKGQVNTEWEEEPFFGQDDGAISVQNAGLVLLHPFLKPFFSEIQLVDERDRLKRSARQAAVQILHFLATSNREFFEANLVFEKFLCGVSLSTPMEKKCLLTEKIMTESIALLQQVIRYWPALKNSSPEWLQQLFLQRKGKLIQDKGRIKLLVERKSQDILLDKLDWNISVVKIPWRKGLLFVEW